MKPVTENNLFADQFFLTRQSANFIEDFAREIRKGWSLFLLYGIGSADKSHLNSLSIPSEIKKQLRSCSGILGKVIEVADPQGSQVSIKPETASESKYYMQYVAGSLLLMLVTSGIYYQNRQPNIGDDRSFPAPTEKTITIVSDNEDVVSISQSEPGSINSGDETHRPASDPLIIEQEHGSTPNPDSEAPVTANTVPIVDLQVESEQPAVDLESTG